MLFICHAGIEVEGIQQFHGNLLSPAGTLAEMYTALLKTP